MLNSEPNPEVAEKRQGLDKPSSKHLRDDPDLFFKIHSNKLSTIISHVSKCYDTTKHTKEMLPKYHKPFRLARARLSDSTASAKINLSNAQQSLSQIESLLPLWGFNTKQTELNRAKLNNKISSAIKSKDTSQKLGVYATLKRASGLFDLANQSVSEAIENKLKDVESIIQNPKSKISVVTEAKTQKSTLQKLKATLLQETFEALKQEEAFIESLIGAPE